MSLAARRLRSWVNNEMVSSRREVAELVMILPGPPSALVYFFFWFSTRRPAWKKPGSDEGMRSPRMKPIKKEGVG